MYLLTSIADNMICDTIVGRNEKFAPTGNLLSEASGW